MKLYFFPGACSLAPHIALREAGTAFDLERVEFPGKKTHDGHDFLAINPKGAVPTLVMDDGDVLTEGVAILQYIADNAKGSNLAPAAGTRERLHLQEWLNYIATELHKGFAPLFKPTTPDAYKAMVNENLAKQFAYLDKTLASRKSLMGDTFTIADAYLFAIMNWRHFHKVSIADYKNLQAYLDRIAARPKVQEAMRAEGLKAAA